MLRAGGGTKRSTSSAGCTYCHDCEKRRCCGRPGGPQASPAARAVMGYDVLQIARVLNGLAAGVTREVRHKACPHVQPRQRVPCLGEASCRQTEMRCYSRWQTRESTSQKTPLHSSDRHKNPIACRWHLVLACLCKVLFARKLGTVGGNVTAHLVGCPV